MKATKLINNIRSYVDNLLASLALSNPMMSIMKPLISRAINKNFGKLNKYCDLISDDNGEIDVDVILLEMLDNIVNTQQFSIDIPLIGPTLVGGGLIKITIPFTNKSLVLSNSDLETFKEYILNN